MLRVDEALAQILAEVRPLAPREVPLEEALGLVLAADLVSPQDHPPFDNSAVDGYAVRCEDLPGPLQVVEEVHAGEVPRGDLGAGQAIQVATGAPLPAGTEAVAMVEDSQRDQDQVTIRAHLTQGENMRPRGEHFQAGEAAIAAGVSLGPAHLALAAYLGYPRLSCRPRPRVGVLTTGDELRPPGEPLGPGQIYNSNAYALLAQLRSLGCSPVYLGTLPDRPEEIRSALQEALPRIDVLVTSAGVSVGPRDYVLKVLQDLGGQLRLWRIAMRPGKPLGFGVIEGKPFFALPGNPVSSMVTFEVFCRPALAQMMGHPDGGAPLRVDAILEEPVTKKAGLRFFYRCRLRPGGREPGHPESSLWHVRLTGPQGSHLLRSLAEADGLLELEEERTRWEAGERVKVRRLWNQLLDPVV